MISLIIIIRAMNPEYTAFQNWLPTATSLMSSGVVGFQSFAHDLIVNRFISGSAAAGAILNGPKSDIAAQLLECVRVQVRISPERYFKPFLEILERRPPMHAVLEGINRDYGKLKLVLIAL